MDFSRKLSPLSNIENFPNNDYFKQSLNKLATGFEWLWHVGDGWREMVATKSRFLVAVVVLRGASLEWLCYTLPLGHIVPFMIHINAHKPINLTFQWLSISVTCTTPNQTFPLFWFPSILVVSVIVVSVYMVANFDQFSLNDFGCICKGRWLQCIYTLFLSFVMHQTIRFFLCVLLACLFRY